jgi:uncharacterized protein
MTIESLLIIAFITLATIVALIIFVMGPMMLLSPRRRDDNFYKQRGEPVRPSDLQLEYEEVWFKAEDESQLHAWFIPSSVPTAGTIFYLHGVGDNKCSGIPLAKIFHDHGFNVFLYDSRAHGMSGGKYCTYGYHEKFDVRLAIDYCVKRKNISPKIGIFGTSMGAAIAVQAAAIEPRIVAVVAEGCFTNLRTITVDYQKRLLRIPWHFLRNFVMKRSEHLAHFRHRDVSPLNSLASVHVPILFIHGKNDTLIRYQYSEELYRIASEPKELYLIQDANHSNIHQVARQEYENRIVNFFERWLK